MDDETLDAAIAAVDARRKATHWAGDARLLQLVMADLEALRVQSPHDPEG